MYLNKLDVNGFLKPKTKEPLKEMEKETKSELLENQEQIFSLVYKKDSLFY